MEEVRNNSIEINTTSLIKLINDLTVVSQFNLVFLNIQPVILFLNWRKCTLYWKFQQNIKKINAPISMLGVTLITDISFRKLVSSLSFERYIVWNFMIDLNHKNPLQEKKLKKFSIFLLKNHPRCLSEKKILENIPYSLNFRLWRSVLKLHDALFRHFEPPLPLVTLLWRGTQYVSFNT